MSLGFSEAWFLKLYYIREIKSRLRRPIRMITFNGSKSQVFSSIDMRLEVTGPHTSPEVSIFLP